MHQAPGESVQKVCPRCGALAYTGDSHCPWCGGGYRRRLWPALLATALVTVVLTLAGVALMLVQAGDEVDATIDREVERIERDLDRSFDEVERSVREELDRRRQTP